MYISRPSPDRYLTRLQWIMPASMWGRVSRSNRQVCQFHGALAAKKFAIFLLCKMSLMADTVEKGLALIGEQ
jgi:hypothetical protein